jgi:plastocyanin
MKSKLHLFIFLLLAFGLNGQVMITEIMYNPPESGNDTNEYIELYNSTSNDIDLTDYSMSGVDYVFNGEVIAAGSYLVLAKDKAALDNLLGTDAIQWTTGALSNGGETLSISDAQGTIIDEVSYDDASPWPTDPNGNGSSLELCDYNLDNSVPENWSASVVSTGQIVNGKEVFASPGNKNCEVTISVTVNATPNNVFSPKDITINPGETVRWVNLGGNHNVDGTQTSYPNNPESFGNGGPSTASWTYDYTFTTPGLYDYKCVPHAGLGMVGTVTVLDPYQVYDITEITMEDVDGKCTEIGTKVLTTGIVNSINWRPTGLDFLISDENNNGVFVFSNSESLGYEVVEGDEIEVKGSVTQFNGKTQIEALEVSLISNGNSTVQASEFSNLSEETEGKIIKLSNYNYVDASEWKGTGSYNVRIFNGTDTVEIRIDEDTDLEGAAAPVAPFDVTGAGAQYDTSSPYLDGYQLLVRYAADIQSVSNTNDLTSLGDINISPNPSVNTVNINTKIKGIEYLEIYNLVGEKVFESTYTNSVDISRFNTGVYIIQLTKGNYIYTEKMIKI